MDMQLVNITKDGDTIISASLLSPVTGRYIPIDPEMLKKINESGMLKIIPSED